MTAELPGLVPFRWEANDGPITPRRPEDDVEFGAAGAVAAGARSESGVTRSGRGHPLHRVEIVSSQRNGRVLLCLKRMARLEASASAVEAAQLRWRRTAPRAGRVLVGRRRFLGGRRHLRCPDPRGHPTPSRGRPTRTPRRDRQRTDLTQHAVGGAPRLGRIATHQTRATRSIPPEAFMRFRFVRPGNIASQLQPVASELIPALRDTSTVEPDRSRSGERS
jgi:hypothetical protein